MEYRIHESGFELDNPWKRFGHRNEAAHLAEDSRLCPDVNTTTTDVIKKFLTHDKHRLDRQVRRRRQLLRDFLNEAILQRTRLAGSYSEDVEQASVDNIALLDDRRKHETCGKLIRSRCDECHIFSRMLSILGLCQRLRESRKTLEAEKRIIYIPNLTSRAALALAATVANRSAVPVRNFLHRYLLGREHVFSISMSWGFFFEFHILYHAMRLGPINATKDTRKVLGKRLRKSEPLPLDPKSKDEEQLYYHEAQTSSLSWGDDEWFWTDLFLVDTYFGSEENHLTYLTNCVEGDGFDPPLGGRGLLNDTRFDPREYFLRKLNLRIEQVTTEYSALVETFDDRMEKYEKKIRYVFEDNNQRTYTKTLSNVIDTIHIFVDCIGGIVDSWNTFNRNEVSLFTRHAPGELEWHRMIAQIGRHVTELDGMRKLLINKRDRFKFKLESFHTISSLSQMENANLQAVTAISQGNDLKMLTKMTVYVAFPLLFTTAFFSMDFMKPKYPWAVFFPVLFLISVLNYMIASQRGPRRVWRDFREWLQVPFGSSGYLII